MPAGNLGDPKAEVPRGNQAGREVAWDHFSCQRSRLPRPVVVARYRGTETAGPSAKRGDSLAPRGTSEFREVSRPRGACSVPFAAHTSSSSLRELVSPQIAADHAVRNERRPARDLNDLARMGLLDKRDKRIGRESKKSSGVSTAGRYSGVLGRLITTTYFARSSSCSTRRPAIPFAVC